MPWKNQGGGPWGSGPKGPWGSGPQPVGPRPPDLEDLLRRGQDRLQQLLPGGHFSGIGIALVLLGALAIWGLSGFFRVQSEELGVVLRFGKYVRDAQPGLNYHLPYPIETVLLPKALRVSTISIGMTLIDDPARRGRTMRDVPEESLMLTGDENIVDVDFTVLWRIKPDGVGDYLFNIQNPEGTVKAVAESAMREVIGRSNIQPILTGARTTTETERAGTDAEDARQLRFGHPGAAGADAEGRSAGAGDRLVPRRAGGARRSRARCRTRRRPMPTASFRTRAAGPRRSCRPPKATSSRRSPRPRARARASSRSTRNTRRRPTSPGSGSISRPWSACSAVPRSWSMTAAVRRRRASCRICR